MTQCEKVLEYMKANGSITTFECFEKLHITRLSARIKDLRDQGVVITKKRVHKNDTHYDVFRLEKAE